MLEMPLSLFVCSYYLFAYDVIHNHVESTSYVGLNYIERKSVVCLNDLSPSLSVLVAKSLEPYGILVDGNAMDEISMLNSFLYYLFAYDDVHASCGIILFGGSMSFGWSTC